MLQGSQISIHLDRKLGGKTLLEQIMLQTCKNGIYHVNKANFTEKSNRKFYKIKYMEESRGSKESTVPLFYFKKFFQF